MLLLVPHHILHIFTLEPTYNKEMQISPKKMALVTSLINF